LAYVKLVRAECVRKSQLYHHNKKLAAHLLDNASKSLTSGQPDFSTPVA